MREMEEVANCHAIMVQNLDELYYMAVKDQGAWIVLGLSCQPGPKSG